MKEIDFDLVDLTHTLSSKVPTWDGSLGFSLKSEGENDQIFVHTSTGTHIDAPGYFFEKGFMIDTLPLKSMVSLACVMNLSEKATSHTVVLPSDIEEYEATHGPIPPHSLVVAYTGWSRHWSNPKAYRNADAKGHLHFPTWGVPALELLLKKQIVGVAIDTLALEPLNSSFPGHKLLMHANKYIIENIAHCHRLPPKGSYILALPLKIHVHEAPARVIGMIPR